MKLENELCFVEISIDTTYSVQSSDNRHYDLELNPKNYGHNDYYKTFAIHIDLFNREIDIALVGDYYSYDFDCAVLDGKVLTILQNNTISQICVYGEMEIEMLDLNFNKVWAFSGRDIFVSQTRENAFVRGEHSVKLYDWEGSFYEIDYTGKLIREQTKQ